MTIQEIAVRLTPGANLLKNRINHPAAKHSKALIGNVPSFATLSQYGTKKRQNIA
jgi:hypothetical protein